MYWKITPHKNAEFDSCVLPAENNADHLAALEYAKERIEDAMDCMEEDSGPIAIIVELHEGDFPEGTS